MPKDFLGLNKIEKDLNKALDLKIFKENQERQRKFPKPKPQYTKDKPILTKAQKQEAKQFIKQTGSAFGSLISKIKNHKIIKLEKEALKNKAKAEALAHKIKTIQANNDSLTDISRYEKELEKLETEARERKAQMEDPLNEEVEHSDSCLDYNFLTNGNNGIKQCICEDRK